MKNKILFYGRRQMAMALIPYLVAKGYEVSVISDEQHVVNIALLLGLKLQFAKGSGHLDIGSGFDLFICCHGNRIIKSECLEGRVCVNIHPCLPLYPGKDPIAKYIANGNTSATIDSHYMTEVVDGGEVISSVRFGTGKVTTYAEFYNQALPYYFELLDNTLKKLNF